MSNSYGLEEVELDPIAAAEKVLAGHTAVIAEGVLLDATTASAIMAVYGALNEVNKAKLRRMSVAKARIVAWKLVEKVGVKK